MRKKIIFVINLISGTTNKAGIPQLIEETLDKEKFDYEVAVTQYAGHASEIAGKAKEDGIDIVVAVGGDGTVNEVARAIVHSPTALGIIPCGSGNGLARHLLLPMNTRKAIEIINTCEIRELDYGIINGYPFFCTCGMGFDAYISMKFSEAGKRGPITYLENVLREGIKYQPETYTVTDENGTCTYEAFLISCANASQYGNNAYIAPQASMSDGLMDVIIMDPFDMIEASQISLDMFNKTLDKNLKIKTYKTKQLHIHREAPGYIHYDGDAVMTGQEVDVRIQEKGIRMIVNPFADKRARRPNTFQSVTAELFNELNIIREDIGKRRRTLGKELQKKLLNKGEEENDNPAE
ncbi:MAG: diacylglycerol/lipid kinase family protein [Prevotella sp.]